MCEGKEKCVQGFGGEGKSHFDGLDVDGMIILKWILRKWGGRVWMSDTLL
jgi:hypothetical protein